MGKAEVIGKGSLEYQGYKVDYINVSMTNPHVVVEYNDLDAVEIKSIGPYIENHKDFPGRTNVEFFKVIDANNIRLRVWERGSGETKACGSGACAVFMALYSQKRCKDKVNVQMPGGTVQVETSATGAIYLTGPVTYVLKGEYSL